MTYSLQFGCFKNAQEYVYMVLQEEVAILRKMTGNFKQKCVYVDIS